MAKQPASDYAAELASQRKAWEAKGSLRAVYRSWYGRIVEELSPQQPVVELGSGCGNFKEFYPEAIATDAMAAGDWIDQVVDARDMPFGSAEIGNIVMVDVLHHLPRPIDFLRNAANVLKDGGRVVLLEPAATPWARLVLGLFHHEPVDRTQDLFAEDGTPEPANEGFTFANQAIASLLFVESPQQLSERVPELELISVERSDFVVYPATGGFSYLNLVPERAVDRLSRIEHSATQRMSSWTAMRLLIVLERVPRDVGPETAVGDAQP